MAESLPHELRKARPTPVDDDLPNSSCDRALGFGACQPRVFRHGVAAVVFLVPEFLASVSVSAGKAFGHTCLRARMLLTLRHYELQEIVKAGRKFATLECTPSPSDRN